MSKKKSINRKKSNRKTKKNSQGGRAIKRLLKFASFINLVERVLRHSSKNHDPIKLANYGFLYKPEVEIVFDKNSFVDKTYEFNNLSLNEVCRKNVLL